MPPPQQNALIRAHCAVCHTTAKPAGGLALDTFDAERPDPGIARMLRVKIADDGALGAASIPQPDAATTDALVRALGAAANEGAEAMGRWRAYVAQEGRNGHSLITARIVQPAPRGDATRSVAAYELTLTCGGKSRQSDAMLARHTMDVVTGTIPSRATEGLTTPVSVVVDDRPTPLATSNVMPANATLLQSLSVLPTRTLTIQPSAFPEESVTFRFADLTPPVRQLLAWCFNGAEPGR